MFFILRDVSISKRLNFRFDKQKHYIYKPLICSTKPLDLKIHSKRLCCYFLCAVNLGMLKGSEIRGRATHNNNNNPIQFYSLVSHHDGSHRINYQRDHFIIIFFRFSIYYYTDYVNSLLDHLRPNYSLSFCTMNRNQCYAREEEKNQYKTKRMNDSIANRRTLCNMYLTNPETGQKKKQDSIEIIHPRRVAFKWASGTRACNNEYYCCRSAAQHNATRSSK